MRFSLSRSELLVSTLDDEFLKEATEQRPDSTRPVSGALTQLRCLLVQRLFKTLRSDFSEDRAPALLDVVDDLLLEVTFDPPQPRFVFWCICQTHNLLLTV